MHLPKCVHFSCTVSVWLPGGHWRKLSSISFRVMSWRYKVLLGLAGGITATSSESTWVNRLKFAFLDKQTKDLITNHEQWMKKKHRIVAYISTHSQIRIIHIRIIQVALLTCMLCLYLHVSHVSTHGDWRMNRIPCTDTCRLPFFHVGVKYF